MSAQPPAANAAIWFSADGFDPTKKGINGRRVAGASFLNGFFAHADVAEFVAVAHSQSDHADFAALARERGVTKPVRGVRLDAANAIAPLETLFYPAPISPLELWRRTPFGAAAWAICGITHTTATRNVMQAIFDIRSAPQMPWDALICTSHAVQSSMRRLMELADQHFALRFPGAILPARPLLPVIPLGVSPKDYERDPVMGQDLRAELGIAADDIVAVCIARLTPDEKFDPMPLFIAMELATQELRAFGSGRLHLILCGQFREDQWKETFATGAARLMPSCGYHLLDGGDATARKGTLSAGDFFVFPIDNVQETFGLAPIEAMAAGLPVIVSDWDGLKDTVTPDTGFRIPTEMPPEGETTYLSQRHNGGTDSYMQYVGQLSAMTRLDVGALRRAIVALASDPELRARMGAAARARVAALFDWKVVIPQMQALWAEQAAIMHHARSKGGPALAPGNAALIPIGPAPEEMFAAYPSLRPGHDRKLCGVDIGNRPDLRQTLELRNYGFRRRLIEDPARIEAILTAFCEAGQDGASVREVAAKLALPDSIVSRVSLWLLKYHFLAEPS